MSNMTEKVVLVVGSCGLDRLLTVESYPEPDTKIRTCGYMEMGGGNAANTATALARLCNASFLGKRQKFRIKLLTKIGKDGIGQELKQQLQHNGVDVSSPLFLTGNEKSTTGFTTIIVSKDTHSRTCLHTPGTCGMLSAKDVDSVDYNDIYHNVVHLHSDCRHNEASCILAQEARRRGIPVSVDAEKDRHSHHQDKLLEYATTIYTNSDQLVDYINRRTGELEDMDQAPHKQQETTFIVNNNPTDETNAIMIHNFFIRWYGPAQAEKEVIITKGSMGSFHVQCRDKKTGNEPNLDHDTACSLDFLTDLFGETFQSETQQPEKRPVEEPNEFNVYRCGVVQNISEVIDSTGAGDAFIAGNILAKLVCHDNDNIPFRLQFGTWVASKKLAGHGAQGTLPWGDNVDKELGLDIKTISTSLNGMVGPFGQQE